MMTNIDQRVIAVFTERFSEPPSAIIRAPGRVNLIGEHTDYNDGFVFPLAIDRAVWIALRPRADRHVVAHLLNLNGREVSFSLDDLQKGKPGPVEYLKGVAWALGDAGMMLNGWEGVIGSDVPISAGLSSSAALELATARAFHAVSDFAWNPARIAQACQRAENAWVGVNSGIMDQMISAAGVADHALLIDCRTLKTFPAPLPPGTCVVILDTNTRRPEGGLVATAYNERRQQCESAARTLGVAALRDVDAAMFSAYSSILDPLTLRRARHVVTENERTLSAYQAMLIGDAVTLGALMDASHISMRDDFDISTPALDAMVTCARKHPGCYGARMTGGGFGGAAVALVAIDQAEDFALTVAACYESATGIAPTITITRATDGAAVIG